jgi:Arc/MetJ-type ribon-helix-helix transcriptional regulator
MTIQIAVRLPEEMVEFVDRLVAAGEAPSRASVLERALAREIRRHRAEQDAAILADAGPDPELVGLAEYAAGIPGGLT